MVTHRTEKAKIKPESHEALWAELIRFDRGHWPRTGSRTRNSPFRLQEAERTVVMKTIAMVGTVSR